MQYYESYQCHAAFATRSRVVDHADYSFIIPEDNKNAFQ